MWSYARHLPTEHGFTLIAPPDRLVATQEGAQFMAAVWWFAAGPSGRDGHRHRSALRRFCVCDGNSRGHHIAPLRYGEAPDSSRIVCSDGDLL
jgi:hypothetical protein